jgi:hypothetical protein
MPSLDDTADLYRIETTRRSVTVFMADGETLSGHVFIHPSPHRPFEPEDITELFNTEEPFFPLDLHHGGIRLVCKARIAEVAIASSEGRGDELSHEAPAPMGPVEIVLEGGEARRGSIRLDVRPGRTRVIDYLNGHNGRFLTLHTVNETRLINRSLINHVRARD